MRLACLSLAALLLTLAGCGSSSVAQPFLIPSSVVSDEPVIPPEIQSAYDLLSSELNNHDFDRWELLTSPLTAASQPMEFRRALVYREFRYMRSDSRDPANVIDIHTLAGDKEDLDSLLAKIAARIDFDYNGLDYDDWPGSEAQVNEVYRTGSTWLEGRHALSVGEYAWIADWIMQNYGQYITKLNPPQLAYFVSN